MYSKDQQTLVFRNIKAQKCRMLLRRFDELSVTCRRQFYDKYSEPRYKTKQNSILYNKVVQPLCTNEQCQYNI